MKCSKSQKGYLLICLSIMLIAGSCKKDNEDIPAEIKDADGNLYTSVIIGLQEWLVENLKTTRLNDGTDIPLVTDNTEWQQLTTAGYCYYNNDETTYKDAYGALYNWFAVNSGKLCPTGWHVPAKSEWETLIDYLGGSSVAGGKLKETGTDHWNNPNTGATNETGFTALPGGYRNALLTFGEIQGYGAWYTSTSDEGNSNYAWYSVMDYLSAEAYFNNYYKKNGLSVRCIKDQE